MSKKQSSTMTKEIGKFAIITPGTGVRTFLEHLLQSYLYKMQSQEVLS